MLPCLFFLLCSSFSGPIKEQISGSTVPEEKPFEPSVPVTSHVQRDYYGTRHHQLEHVMYSFSFSNCCLVCLFSVSNWNM